VKTFERVEGATIRGEGPANGTVTAVVQMRDTDDGQNFSYRQEAKIGADGQFEMTVPYSTTGYDQYGPANGYTNVSVRAAGPYVIGTTPTTNESAYVIANRGTVDVSEGRVVGADPTPVTAELERTVLSIPEGRTNQSQSGEEAPSDSTAKLAAPDGWLDTVGQLAIASEPAAFGPPAAWG
jgi:dolichyl-diphosphooligosaccharide--protein glycosyltransferase